MATVSTRIEDNLKSAAEKVAEDIGIPLSTAINVFLKRFVAAQGFPFSVTVPVSAAPVIDVAALDAAVKRAVADQNNQGVPDQFTYLDPSTNQLITIRRKE